MSGLNAVWRAALNVSPAAMGEHHAEFSRFDDREKRVILGSGTETGGNIAESYTSSTSSSFFRVYPRLVQYSYTLGIGKAATHTSHHMRHGMDLAPGMDMGWTHAVADAPRCKVQAGNTHEARTPLLASENALRGRSKLTTPASNEARAWQYCLVPAA